MLTEEIKRPLCSRCGTNECKKNGISKNGFQKYSRYCNPCEKAVYNLNDTKGREYSYKQHRKSACEVCNFIPEHPCQLDVDHIDGNKQNNEINNLQTLCANCHRLKTYKLKNHL